MEKFSFVILAAFLAAGCGTEPARKEKPAVQTQLVCDEDGKTNCVPLAQEPCALYQGDEGDYAACMAALKERRRCWAEADGKGISRDTCNPGKQRKSAPAAPYQAAGAAYPPPPPTRSATPYPTVTSGMQRDLCNHPFFGGLQGLRELYRC